MRERVRKAAAKWDRCRVLERGGLEGTGEEDYEFLTGKYGR